MCLDWDQAVFEWICELSFKSIFGTEKKYSTVCKPDRTRECKPYLLKSLN